MEIEAFKTCANRRRYTHSGTSLDPKKKKKFELFTRNEKFKSNLLYLIIKENYGKHNEKQTKTSTPLKINIRPKENPELKILQRQAQE